MKKIVRLTESDLVRLVKRVINEQQAQGRTSQYAWNDITEYIDIEGNQDCGQAFSIIDGELFPKTENITVLKKDDTLYLGYKLPKEKAQKNYGMTYVGGSINNCSVNETQASKGFGITNLFKQLIANPGKPFAIKYTI